MKEIRKKLSANDVGTTGGHQAGILVPKAKPILSFFPVLDSGVKNPRITLVMSDKNGATRWEFNFIYYNNRLFGGTRSEYRLTCMTEYIRSVNAKAGDELLFRLNHLRSYEIGIARAHDRTSAQTRDGALALSGGWKIVNY
jgi:hypothetical protein